MAIETGLRFFPQPDADMGEERWVDVDGVRTRYFDQGSGERIVFIHGGNMGSADGAGSGRTWIQNFSVLKEHHNCIAFDKLGQGKTGLPRSDADYTMHATVQHAAATLEKIGKGPYHIVGHSRGGYVVTRIALERPDLVKTCIMVSSGSLSPGTPRNRLVHKNPPEPRLGREAQRWTYERYSYNPRIVTEAWLDESVAMAESENGRIAAQKMNEGGLLRKQFLPGLHRQRAETHRWLLESGMPCPTFIMWGFLDPTADFEAGKLLIEMFMKKQPRTELRVFNKSGHFVFREYPASFNRALHGWVSRHR
jgi:2-hydroxy-6-oxonona-2,4-dienedioate hydrolase